MSHKTSLDKFQMIQVIKKHIPYPQWNEITHNRENIWKIP